MCARRRYRSAAQGAANSFPARSRETRRERDPEMNERDFYTEKDETKQQTLVCPHCRQEGTYPIRWKVSSKKDQLPRGAGSEDRAKFEKARTYMVRLDDMVACRNIRCRKRFELTGQTTFLL
jgi:hypothetical protein